MGICKNVKVYGLNESTKASKYPMAIDTESCTDVLTDIAKRLAKCAIGTGHDNYLSGIVVQFDLTFTVKAWTEFERYHFAQIVSSQSTMHRIEKFDIEKQCIEYVDKRIIDVVKDLREKYIKEPTAENRLALLYSCPTGIKLTARISTNYRQLKTMYAQRKNHRLPEWRDFCKWIEMLPHSELITGECKQNNRCVCCGEIIPEGRQVCWGCERNAQK